MEVERLYTSRGATLEVRLLAEDICFSMYKKYLLSAMLQSESHATYFAQELPSFPIQVFQQCI